MNPLFSTPRRDDILANLPPDQRERLNQWLTDGLTYLQIRDRILQPPPLGFGLSTSESALRRYYQKSKLADQLADTDDTIQSLPHPENSLKNLLHQSALTTALQTELPPATFQILARYYRNLTREQFEHRLAHQRDLQLQLNRDRLNHHRRVFEFNAARAALAALSQLQKIANDPNMDDEQKVWAAHDHIFGPFPDTQPQPKPRNQFIQ